MIPRYQIQGTMMNDFRLRGGQAAGFRLACRSEPPHQAHFPGANRLQTTQIEQNQPSRREKN